MCNIFANPFSVHSKRSFNMLAQLLAAQCQEAGCKATIYPVEGGCQGLVTRGKLKNATKNSLMFINT